MSATIRNVSNYTQIIADLRSGELSSFYFAMGSDYYLYRQFIGEFQAAFTSRYGDNADYVQRWGADLKTVADVGLLLGGGGLFSSASLILLHEIQDASATVKTNLAKLLGKLPQDTVVLVHYSVNDIRNAKWLSAIQNIAKVVLLTSPGITDLSPLVKEMATQHGLSLDEGALFRLIELSRGELAIIDNELEKLALYLDDSDEMITRELVDHVTGAVENAQVIQFIDAVSNRDRQTAIHTLVEINHRGKDGLPYLVAILHNRLIQLMALRETPEARKSIGQGATSYFFLKDLKSFDRKYTLPELQLATRKLAALDLQFRLGSMDLLVAFSTWVSEVV